MLWRVRGKETECCGYGRQTSHMVIVFMRQNLRARGSKGSRLTG